MANYLGREESVGFGIQSGTSSVAPQVWVRHLGNSFKPVVNKKQNESAMGRTEKVNGSTIISTWSEGTIDGKVQATSIGYLLASLTGGVTTASNADASGTVYDHSFPLQSSGVHTLLTVGVKNPVDDRRYANGEVTSLEITSDNQDYVMFKSDLVASAKETANNTVAFISGEAEFTSAHVSVKIADTVAGLSAATALEARSLKLTLSRSRKPNVLLGSTTSTENDTEPFEAMGEIVLRYKTTDLENLWYNNTARALQITIANSDVTIGTAAHPSLTFVAPQATFDTFDKSGDLDNYVEQTITFYCELSEGDDYAILPTLTNTQANYVAA